jgi:hypothetical protein
LEAQDDVDLDGREDILDCLYAEAEARTQTHPQSRLVRVSLRLRLNRGGTASDILEEWLVEPTRATGQTSGVSTTAQVEQTHEIKRRQQLLDQLKSQLSSQNGRSTLFIASSLDRLPDEDRVWLGQEGIADLLATEPGTTFLFSAGPMDMSWSSPIETKVVVLNGPEPAEVAHFLSRYDTSSTAMVLAKSKNIRYAGYKSVVQTYERELREVARS